MKKASLSIETINNVISGLEEILAEWECDLDLKDQENSDENFNELRGALEELREFANECDRHN